MEPQRSGQSGPSSGPTWVSSGPDGEIGEPESHSSLPRSTTDTWPLRHKLLHIQGYSRPYLSLLHFRIGCFSAGEVTGCPRLRSTIQVLVYSKVAHRQPALVAPE